MWIIKETKMNLNIIEIPYIEHYENQKKNIAAWFFVNDGERRVAVFVCPFCEVPGELNGRESNHKINPDGTVNPSVYCTCGKFHAYVKLADYQKQLNLIPNAA